MPDGARFCNPSGTLPLYTAVAGDCFAYGYWVTEPCEYWTSIYIDTGLANAGTAVVRGGWYDDVAGPSGPAGYPQCLKLDAGNLTIATGASIQALPAINRPVHMGLNWLVLCIQSLTGTTTLNTICGPSMLLPSSNIHALTTAAIQPIAWKVTGVAAGALPTVFPTTGTLVGVDGVGTASTIAPYIAVTRIIQ